MKNDLRIEDLENLIMTERLQERAGINDLLTERNGLHEVKVKRNRITTQPVVVKRRFKVQNQDSATESKALTTSTEPLTAASEIINGLRVFGIEAKPFCFHKQKEKEKSFVVQGENFKWVVVPIMDYKKPEEIPSEMFRKLATLKQHGIKHNGIAIAFPFKGDASKVIKKEMVLMAESLVLAAGCIVALPFAAVAGLIEACTKDPVLLVRFGNFFCELGRWE